MVDLSTLTYEVYRCMHDEMLLWEPTKDIPTIG